MSGSCYVYMWTNVRNGMSYVGKGTGNRAKAHSQDRSTKVSKLPVDAMKQFGKDMFELRILADGMDGETAYAVESAAISAYTTKHPHGYNGLVGRPFTGDEPLNRKVCGHFSNRDHERLFKWSEAVSEKEKAVVTVAELVRRAVLKALERSGF